MRNDGISVIALVIVLLLLSVLGIGLTSLIITKQKSAPLLFTSIQAFYLAQAGIEYAIRYTSDNQSDFWANPDNIFPVTKSLGAGSFIVTYNAGNRNVTSTGTVSTAKKVVTLASFPSYVAGGGITLEPGNPPYQGTIPLDPKNVNVPNMNSYDYNAYIFRIDLAKGGGVPAGLNRITISDIMVWTGGMDVSTDHKSPTPFPFNQVSSYTMAPGAGLVALSCRLPEEVSGTWDLTFYYSKQTDLSNPGTSTVRFVIL